MVFTSLNRWNMLTPIMIFSFWQSYSSKFSAARNMCASMVCDLSILIIRIPSGQNVIFDSNKMSLSAVNKVLIGAIWTVLMVNTFPFPELRLGLVFSDADADADVDDVAVAVVDDLNI
jgi:hypothetical protein